MYQKWHLLVAEGSNGEKGKSNLRSLALKFESKPLSYDGSIK